MDADTITVEVPTPEFADAIAIRTVQLQTQSTLTLLEQHIKAPEWADNQITLLIESARMTMQKIAEQQEQLAQSINIEWPKKCGTALCSLIADLLPICDEQQINNYLKPLCSGFATTVGLGLIWPECGDAFSPSTMRPSIRSEKGEPNELWVQMLISCGCRSAISGEVFVYAEVILNRDQPDVDHSKTTPSED